MLAEKSPFYPPAFYAAPVGLLPGMAFFPDHLSWRNHHCEQLGRNTRASQHTRTIKEHAINSLVHNTHGGTNTHKYSRFLLHMPADFQRKLQDPAILCAAVLCSTDAAGSIANIPVCSCKARWYFYLLSEGHQGAAHHLTATAAALLVQEKRQRELSRF